MTCGIAWPRCSLLARRGVGDVQAACRRDDLVVPRGIVHVLRTGVTWADVPTETIGRSGVTCWRRLRGWTEAGLRPRLYTLLLAELRRPIAAAPAASTT
ncbi:transposase [Streptomyces sp. MJP52]|nr:transposase [Streptomyces sp. MJP52]